MKILLTFVGFHDPYTVGLIGDEELPGPILSLVKAVSFNKTILISTPNTQTHTAQTRDALNALSIETDVIDMPLGDPTDYIQILGGLRKSFINISHEHPGADFFISVASGTPQMHACWLLLTASGEIPARILHIRPPRFVTKEKPLVSEIDLTSKDFPIVKANIFSDGEYEATSNDINLALREIGIVGDHPSMKKAVEISAILAPTDVPILVLGETGTGKELFAKLIHRLSDRATGPFIPVNCAAIPKELVESILFGHKRGSFTGAVTDQAGKFDLANNGTLFLDELAELPVSIQSKFLRVLQDGMVEPLGHNKSHKVNVRIIAATNQKIKEAIKTGKFRQDLYYRLNIGEIHLPPLRERRTDIPKIALYVLEQINNSLKAPKRLSTDALKKLQTYSWPGNARDLGNLIERSMRLSKKTVLEPEDLLMTEPTDSEDIIPILPVPEIGFSLEKYISDTRRHLIKSALELAKGNQSEAARLLNISPQAVHKFLKKE
ncbi:MAG: hypothetical protein C0392_04175 [Syntrophus sp. (in: bacteria)]|nr:hypothetical protein [Syntrophus sp. (in: bacteria)]